MKRILVSLIVLNFLVSQKSLAQQVYWPKEFIRSHSVKSISKLKNPSRESQLVLKLNYNEKGEEISRWELSDTIIYLSLKQYNNAGQVSKSTRLMQSLAHPNSPFDTIQFSEFIYPNDSTQERISWTPEQTKQEASHYVYPIKLIEKNAKRPNFGEATFNEEGLLIEDHWGFRQKEAYGCIVQTTGNLYYRQLNYDKFKRKVSETWFRNELFYKSVNYYYDDNGLLKFELISQLNNSIDSLIIDKYVYYYH